MAPPTQFQSVRLLCAAAAAPPPSLSVTGPTLEVASKRPKQQSRVVRTNQPPSHKYRWGSRSRCHRTPVAAGAGGCSRVANVAAQSRSEPFRAYGDQFNLVGNIKGPEGEAASRGIGKATKRARRRRSRRADYTAAKRTVVNGSWGSGVRVSGRRRRHGLHPGQKLPVAISNRLLLSSHSKIGW